MEVFSGEKPASAGGGRRKSHDFRDFSHGSADKDAFKVEREGDKRGEGDKREIEGQRQSRNFLGSGVVRQEDGKGDWVEHEDGDTVTYGKNTAGLDGGSVRVFQNEDTLIGAGDSRLVSTSNNTIENSSTQTVVSVGADEIKAVEEDSEGSGEAGKVAKPEPVRTVVSSSHRKELASGWGYCARCDVLKVANNMALRLAA